ncbi:hypothetical protein ACFLRI_02145 [Bacteroidota bacterium]
MRKNLTILVLFFLTTGISSCEFMLGSRQNADVDAIFEQGRIDPNLSPQSVGYVPIMPIWDQFSNPVDVFVGYDEMVYVVDDNGLNILDLKGELHRTIAIPGATEVIQDRRIHTYVIGKVIVTVFGQPKELTAVYHLKNTATMAGPDFVDTLIHPFCDASRKNTPFRNEDLNVDFTGLAVLADNTLYVSRTGTYYDQSSSARPDNTVLFFDPDGKNISYAKGLNPINPNLKSVIGVSAIATFAGPPQKLYGVSESHEFLICQADQTQPIEFRVLWIREYSDPDAGIEYGENPELLTMDPSKADGFLYEPNKFVKPEDVYIAPDQTSYIFIVDSGTDRFYQFTSRGLEGVPPPANSNYTKNVKVSFGSEGNGLFEFNDPMGVCYFNKMIYIADKGNNRVIRYRLNTDLE